MAYLNKQARDALRNELKTIGFNKAKAKLHHMDSKSRLAFFRNVQRVGQWSTRFELPSLGTRVTLIESLSTRENGRKIKTDYELVDVLVDPTPDNKN